MKQKEKLINDREYQIKNEIKLALTKQIREKKMNIEREFYKDKDYIDSAINEDNKKK